MSWMAGVVVSLIGGLASILLGFFLTELFPLFLSFGGSTVLILKIFMIVGGIVSILGVFLSYFRPMIASIIISIAALVAGVNIITIIGARLIRVGRGVKKKYDFANPQWLEEQYYTLNRSNQEIANDQNMSAETIKYWIEKLDRTKVSQT